MREKFAILLVVLLLASNVHAWHGPTSTVMRPHLANLFLNSFLPIESGAIVGACLYDTEERIERTPVIIRLSKTGSILWAKWYLVEMCPQAVTSSCKGIFVAGNGIVMKLNEWGGVEWAKKFEISLFPSFSDIEVTREGDIVLVGETWGGEDHPLNAWILVLYQDGNVKWQGMYMAGTGNSFSSVEDDGKGLLVLGEISADNGTDMWLARFSYEGDLIWQKTYDIRRMDVPVGMIVGNDETMSFWENFFRAEKQRRFCYKA